MEIQKIVYQQRRFYKSGTTKSLDFRVSALARLRKSIQKHTKDIEEALKSDLGKCSYEAYMSEIGFVLDELSYMERHLCCYVLNRPVLPSKMQIPALCFRSPQPYGVTLIMSPWNYPFMLTIAPLIGAIAAGNCAVVKPSAYSPATSGIIKKIIDQTFERGHVDVITGGRKENEELLEQRFDYIFFTGSVQVGKFVMEKASQNLTPVSLELGGKSPCIVDETADLRMAAKRIVFGKYLNAGQTCVAPDYLFVQESVKERLMFYMRKYIEKFYGTEPLQDKTYGKIVNARHFARLRGLIEGEKIYYGGGTNEETLQIEPTILDGITPQSKVMQEEIFGPIMPVLTFKKLEEVIDYVNSHEKPLAFYYFTMDKMNEKRMLRACSFGGGCINDTILHLATSRMPFGGVGYSGMGGYHGKYSFDTFTHYRSIVKKPTILDVPLRYRPYKEWMEVLLKAVIK